MIYTSNGQILAKPIVLARDSAERAAIENG